MSPHRAQAEAWAFRGEIDRERAERKPGEPPTLRNALLLLSRADRRHPNHALFRFPTVAYG